MDMFVRRSRLLSSWTTSCRRCVEAEDAETTTCVPPEKVSSILVSAFTISSGASLTERTVVSWAFSRVKGYACDKISTFQSQIYLFQGMVAGEVHKR